MRRQDADLGAGRWLAAAAALVLAHCAPDPLRFTAVTFNTGTSERTVGGLLAESNGGYGPEQAAISDQYYGDGLAWPALITEVARFFESVAPDLVAFQEVFYSGDCAQIPLEAHPGFVCEGWQAGDPTVAQQLVGAGYQVACHVGMPDKCLAVSRRFGRIRGCEGDLCLDGLQGSKVEGCGHGARVGRAVVELAEGGTLTAVNVHGNSGLEAADMACRTQQFERVFSDLGMGDGTPGANGERNLIMGDLNTDPARLAGGDPSADAIVRYVGRGKAFHFVSPIGAEAPPTYAGIVNIDHVISDVFGGECWAPGVMPGHPPLTSIAYFDHKPLVCVVQEGEELQR